MAINKVNYGNTTLIDLTSDTVNTGALVDGYTAHDARGVQITGTFDPSIYYEKTGGNISGNVDVDGTLKFNIEDEDYDVSITFNRRLDENRGTVLTLNGAASGTPYKTVIENVGTPVNNFDAVNKKYVDDLTSIVWITGLMDGSSIIVSSNAYENCYDAITTNKSCYLKLTTTEGAHVLRLKSWIDYNSHSTHGDSFLFVDNVNGYTTKRVVITYSGATYTETELEQTNNKVTSWSATGSDISYPSEKLVLDSITYIVGNFVRNPVLIYDKTAKLQVAGTINTSTDSANGLLNQGQGEGTSRDISSWNIEGMDLSSFKRLRIIFRRASDTLGTTGELYLPLEGDVIPTRNIYASGTTVPAYGNRNRLNTIGCAVDANKSKFCVTQTLSLYGTAATTISDMYVEKIYGCYN